jgi:hypothetical protein
MIGDRIRSEGVESVEYLADKMNISPGENISSSILATRLD